MHRTFLAVIVVFLASPAWAQDALAKWTPQNLQFFPKDIGREQLTQTMRSFSFALNVRCRSCHTGGNGVSFDGVDFGSDEKPAKVKARAMLRMVEHLNTTMLPQLPSRAEPRVVVTCATCHRGLALPKSLQKTLFEVIEKDGVPAAIARYRSLRESMLVSGQYSFDEWEVNELARHLVEAKNTDAAIAILELNGEFNPKSAAIDFQIGELHRQRGERDRAIERYRAALTKAPKHQMVIQRLAELEKKQH